jgi:hypothetical protein
MFSFSEADFQVIEEVDLIQAIEAEVKAIVVVLIIIFEEVMADHRHHKM